MAVTDTERLDVKFFVAPVKGAKLDVKRFMPIFQQWIQEDRLPGLLLDVADYTHVTEGPSMVLVAHEGQYVLDEAEGRLGMLYSHRRGVKGDFDARLAESFRRALRACALIEAEPVLEGRLRCSGEVLFRINDRLHAPNTPATFDAVRPALAALTGKLFGSTPATLEARPASGDAAFTVAIRAQSTAPASDLLSRLGN